MCARGVRGACEFPPHDPARRENRLNCCLIWGFNLTTAQCHALWSRSARRAVQTAVAAFRSLCGEWWHAARGARACFGNYGCGLFGFPGGCQLPPCCIARGGTKNNKKMHVFLQLSAHVATFPAIPMLGVALPTRTLMRTERPARAARECKNTAWMLFFCSSMTFCGI